MMVSYFRWEQLKEQFNPDDGSMIRFQDWLQFKRYLCLDLTRVSDRIQSPTEPVSLIFIGTRNDNLNTPVQVYFLIERLNQVTFRFSSSDVAIVVGKSVFHLTAHLFESHQLCVHHFVPSLSILFSLD